MVSKALKGKERPCDLPGNGGLGRGRAPGQTAAS